MTKKARLNPVDQDAFERAIELAKQESLVRREQIDWMLDARPWQEVARFCAYCCQDHALQLKPWQVPPCWIRSDPDETMRAKGPDLGPT